MGTIPSCVRMKVFRAYQHFRELEREFESYYDNNPGKVVVDEQSDPINIWLTFYPKDPLPMRFPIIAGDFLQNLRSALDYLVWELVLAQGKTPGTYNMFPITKGPTSTGFEDAIKWHGNRPGKLEGIHPDAVTVIRGLQPYRWGADWEKDLLWVLNELTNINKHRRIPLATLQSGLANDIKLVEIDGKLWASGTFPKVNKDAKMGPFNMTAQVNMNPKILAFVALDETIAKGKEIATVLIGILEYINDGVLPQFERFFA